MLRVFRFLDSRVHIGAKPSSWSKSSLVFIGAIWLAENVPPTKLPNGFEARCLMVWPGEIVTLRRGASEREASVTLLFLL